LRAARAQPIVWGYLYQLSVPDVVAWSDHVTEDGGYDLGRVQPGHYVLTVAVFRDRIYGEVLLQKSQGIQVPGERRIRCESGVELPPDPAVEAAGIEPASRTLRYRLLRT